MQKLREFRHVHELAWGDEILRDPETGRTRTKAERGRALCDQRANAIADMAAVLAGAGGGNKMWIETEEERRARLSLRPIQVDWEAVKAKRKLYDVTVWWDNLRDKLHAQEWSSNVRHLELADWVPPEMPYAEAEDVEGAEDDGVDLHAESTISKDEVRRPVVA